MNSQVMSTKPMLKPTLDPNPLKRKMAMAGERFLNWVCANYKIIVDALDEGERIHQLIQERKNEDQLKAIRNGIRFY